MAKRHSIRARDIEARTKTVYPAEFAHVTNGRAKRALGNAFGLDQFGVNLTDLAPGAASALKHWHTQEDELVYVLSGEVVLLIGDDEEILTAGDCIGFKAGAATGHAIINRSGETATILEVGSRRMDIDEGHYPDVDLHVIPDGKGGRRFVRKDGSEV
ncbi:MAG: cupin domain-containing protein [Rhodobiaceae bacterium]|nr:cupin domain-containing protein [Rhodobiaceae bacterium]MCC0017993.1 cupin domain-containing protein [Rhodobiaceae bacterium]MCC0052219.1 cupin domain-containing protein [Rhodobiaceae bacterium]MCC0062055.1 cupin domain-containing protein [Rhodobiaceae bacterium]